MAKSGLCLSIVPCVACSKSWAWPIAMGLRWRSIWRWYRAQPILQQCYSRVTVWRSSRPLAVAKRGGRMKYEDPLIIGGKEFQSQLIVSTGKYPTLELMQQCHEASGADMVTVAVRRMELPTRVRRSWITLTVTVLLFSRT